MSNIRDNVALPPGLQGETQFELTLTVDEIVWTGVPPLTDTQIGVVWWGQAQSEAVYFSPVNIKNFTKGKSSDILLYNYAVKTSSKKFEEYLSDASPLRLQLFDKNGQLLGCSAVNNLQTVVDNSPIDGYFPIIQVNSKVLLANIRVQISFSLPQVPDEPKKPVDPQVAKLTLKSKSKRGSSLRSQRVTFSDTEAPVDPKSLSGSLARLKTPIADSLIAELLNQSQELRESLRLRLESNDDTNVFKPQNVSYNQCSGKIDSPRNKKRGKENKGPVSKESGSKVAGAIENSFSCGAGPVPGPRPAKEDNNGKMAEDTRGRAESLPTWNIPISRMKFLGKVKQLIVTLAAARLNSSLLERLHEPAARPSFVAAAPRNCYQTAAGGRRTQRAALSFFLKLKLPGDQAGPESSFCSRKLNSNLVDFSERIFHAVTFNSRVLDEWWPYSLDVKLFSRQLHHKSPIHLATASIGLKYLLMYNKYSTGDTISLPLYASQTVFRELKLSPSSGEIVGNLDVSFLFQLGGEFLSRSFPGEKTDTEETERAGSNAVISGEAEHEATPVPRERIPTRTLSSASPAAAAAAGSVPPFSHSVLFHLRVEQSPGSDSRNKEMLIKYRNFANIEMQADFRSGEEIRETVALFLPGHEARFHNRQMLSRLRDNFIVFEAWNRDSLLGIGRVPTNSLYEVFKSGNSTELFECCNGVIDIYDIFDSEKVGQIFVTISAGSQKKIAALNHQREDAADPTNLSRGSAEEEEDDCSEKEAVHEIGVQTSLCDSQSLSTMDTEKSGVPAESPLPDEPPAENPPGNSPDGQLDSPASPSQQQTVLDTTDCNNVTREAEAAGHTESVRLEVVIEEGRNLPLLKAKDGVRHIPRVYVSLPESLGQVHGENSLETETVVGVSPVWHHRTEAWISLGVLMDPRQHFILKVWHQVDPRPTAARDKDKDQVLGFVAVDLAPLLSPAFPRLSGWYNIINWVGKCRGQLKISITPKDSISTDSRVYYEMLELQADGEHPPPANQSQPDSNQPATGIQFEVQSSVSELASSPDRNLLEKQYWTPPRLTDLPADSNTSCMEALLHRNLADLSLLLQGLSHSPGQPANTGHPPSSQGQPSNTGQLPPGVGQQLSGPEHQLPGPDGLDNSWDNDRTFIIELNGTNQQSPNVSLSGMQRRINKNLNMIRQLRIEPGALTPPPQHVSSLPQHVSSHPQHVSSHPQHVSSHPQPVLSHPQHVSCHPQHVLSHPQHVSSHLQQLSSPPYELPVNMWSQNLASPVSFAEMPRTDLPNSVLPDLSFVLGDLGLGEVQWDEVETDRRPQQEEEEDCGTDRSRVAPEGGNPQ